MGEGHEGKLKYVRLLGGLGNNLFQLAVGYHLKLNLHSTVIFFRYLSTRIKLSQENSWNYQQNDKEVKSIVEDFGVFGGYFSRSFSSSVFESAFTPGGRLRNLIKLKTLRTLGNQNDTCWYPTSEDFERYDVFSGYFQNAGLVRELPQNFFDLLVQSCEAKVDKGFVQQAKDYDICIQVRRGDYRFHKENIGMLSDRYFIEALERLGLSPSSARVLILTDEPEACSLLAKLIPHSTISGPDKSGTLTTLFTMAKASNLIISNSSLAWWGGLLAKRDGAKVVAPYPWKVQTCANHDPKVLYNDVGFTTQKSNFAM